MESSNHRTFKTHKPAEIAGIINEPSPVIWDLAEPTNDTMDNATITTTDFYLAAYLLAKNHQLAGHVRANGKSQFEFEGNGINELLNDFYQDRAAISPLAYAKTIRDLKAIMYNGTTLKPLNDYDSTTATKGSE